jgi:hypothetical protein
MDDKECIERMISLHEEYRESLILDCEKEERRYTIFNMLLQKIINGGDGTYGIEKENIKLEHIYKMNNKYQCETSCDLENKFDEIWRNSIKMLLNDDKIYCTQDGIKFIKDVNSKLLDIGKQADFNIERIEFVKLKIKLMNKEGAK